MTAFAAFAEECEHRIALEVERRPGNALNIEIGAPVPRCRCATPEEWGAVDPRAKRWLASGGTPLVLGNCGAVTCPIYMATKKASGVNIPEAQRTTVQVKLRLDVDVAEDLDELAARWGTNRSQCVARMVAQQEEAPLLRAIAWAADSIAGDFSEGPVGLAPVEARLVEVIEAWKAWSGQRQSKESP